MKGVSEVLFSLALPRTWLCNPFCKVLPQMHTHKKEKEHFALLQACTSCFVHVGRNNAICTESDTKSLGEITI